MKWENTQKVIKESGVLKMVVPSFSDFKQLATQGNLIPIFEEVHFDWETPLSAFRKIDNGKFSFLLESVEGGEQWGRYSFLGSSPAYLFRSKGEKFEIVKDGEILLKGKERDPLRALEGFLGNYRPVLFDSLPRFFGGAVGYINYDVIRSFERMPELLPPDHDLYECHFMITDTMLAFDNLKQKVKVISNVFLDGQKSLKEVYQEAQEKIERIVAKLRRSNISFFLKRILLSISSALKLQPRRFFKSSGKGQGIYQSRRCHSGGPFPKVFYRDSLSTL